MPELNPSARTAVQAALARCEETLADQKIWRDRTASELSVTNERIELLEQQKQELRAALVTATLVGH